MVFWKIAFYMSAMHYGALCDKRIFPFKCIYLLRHFRKNGDFGK